MYNHPYNNARNDSPGYRGRGRPRGRSSPYQRPQFSPRWNSTPRYDHSESAPPHFSSPPFLGDFRSPPPPFHSRPRFNNGNTPPSMRFDPNFHSPDNYSNKSYRGNFKSHQVSSIFYRCTSVL